ncbi:hypothetical protein DRQ25_01565 [Candidatus Fermentibacteria bacterium]|nr:MAG: hypothetical protein DRQ25_01565 [Candidatus Fermentibacteria bacterium]
MTTNIDAIARDAAKKVKNTKSDFGELTPGATGRRYEPEGGVTNHNERIHRESRHVDNHMNMPFTFSKPKREARAAYYKCPDCDYIHRGNVNTYGLICPECHKFVILEEVQDA